MKKMIFICSLIFSLSSLATSGSRVQTVPFVDLNRYLGDWYEIATIPQSFQKACVKNVKAQYSLTKTGLVKVVNSCETKNGKTKIANARAKVVDKDSNAKLKVTFVKIFDWVFSLGGNYWILDLADDYSYAVVGDPTTEYGWILSRTQTLSPEVLERAKVVLEENGYDLCKFKMTIQDNGVSENSSLCH
ncbi:MAG: lipocalin family protein [Bacteriovoracaceae bacterium]